MDNPAAVWQQNLHEAATSRAYDYDLSHFASWLQSHGIIEPQHVTTKIIEDYLQQLDTFMTRKARVRSSIAALFKFLMNREIITSNPCERLESIKLVAKEPGYLTQQQCLAFMAAVNKATPYYWHRDMALMNLLLKSGLRRAEIVSLNIEDIDLAQGSLRVTRKGGKRQAIHYTQS